MAIKITFDSSHNVISPTLVLTTRNGNRLGGLLYHNLVVKPAIRQSMEMSFSVNKSDYCEKNHNVDLWNLIADFKLVWCKEWNCYFEINVTTSEECTTDKEITAISLGDAELSQINLYDIQINTEDDIARDDYEPTVLYNESNTNASLLHRIMEKAPHYTVKYVDPNVASMQRTFTFDNRSLHDAFQEIAEEMECIFDIECRHAADGIERSISVYSLENYGNDTNILLTTDVLADNVNYSVDTGAVKNCFRLEGGDDLMTATIRNCNPNGSSYIWYISDELKSDMSDELVEQLKNYNEQYDYFYKYYNPFDTEIKNYTGKMLVARLLEDYGYGGSVDLLHRPLVPMTNIVNAGWSGDVYDKNGVEIYDTLHIITFLNSDGTVAGNFTPIVVNSNGSYVETLSPSELEQYATSVLNSETDDSESSKLQIGSLFYGNSAVQKAAEALERITELQTYYYGTDNTEEFINPEIIIEYQSSISEKTNVINDYNTLVKKYQVYTDDYSEIKTPINGYPAIMEAYYNTIDFYYYLNNSLMPTVEMSDTNARIEGDKLHYQSLKNTAIQNLSSTTSVATVNSAIESMAKAIVDTRYQVKVLDDECSFNYSTTEGRASTWNGKIKITNYSNDKDWCIREFRLLPISSDYVTFLKQKLESTLSNTRTNTIADIKGLFNLADRAFKAELKKYSLERLKAFHDACQSCVDVLIQQGVADSSNTESDMYQSIYLPYLNKLSYIQSEMDLRQKELYIIAGKYDENGGLLELGIQYVLEQEKDQIQQNLDFETYLGESLWHEFIAYRREDTYSNTNYVSDGLGNDELFERAMELIQVAKEEIVKSATTQHTIDARLKNLLVMKEFEPLIENFSVGNWLRIKVDNNLFKLRLVDYQIDFENLESINVTFSDITTDGSDMKVKDIIKQASSMATSYNAVSRQAKKGKKGADTVTGWIESGLDLTTTKIVDTADNQEVTWNKHGLLCREFDEMSGTYSDKQVKLINKGLYVTDDNWYTAKTGIGNFTYFNPAANNGNGEYQNAYGVVADTIVGNIILSENVGIYNTKSSIVMNDDGFTLTTNNIAENEIQPVFTIRRKYMSNNESLYDNMFYIDSNGYLTINGGVKVTTSNNQNSGTLEGIVNAESVRLAWNGTSKYMAFEYSDNSPSLNIYSSTLSDNADSTEKNNKRLIKLDTSGLGIYTATDGNLQMKLDNNGSWFYKDGVATGKIGTNFMGTGENSLRGLTFDLETNASFMSWAYKESGTNFYETKLIYYPNTTELPDSEYEHSGIFLEKGFHFQDDMYLATEKTLHLGNHAEITTGSTGLTLQNQYSATRIYGNGAGVSLAGDIGLSPISGGVVNCGSDLYMNNNVIYDTTVATSSDARLKTNIVDSNINALSLLNQIDIREFDWIKSQEHTNAGIIAQQLQEVIPELVQTNPNNGRLSIKSDNFIPYLIKAIQEIITCLSNDTKYKNVLKLLGVKFPNNKSDWKDSLTVDEKQRFITATEYKPAREKTNISAIENERNKKIQEFLRRPI